MNFVILLIPLIGILPAIIVAVTRRNHPLARLTEPHCAKCGYDLRGYTADPPTRCSECGSDLTTRHAIRWGESNRPRGVIRAVVIGITITALLLIAVFNLMLLRRVRVGLPFVGAAALAPGGATNQALLTSLVKTMQQPWDWQELDRRLVGNMLSTSETSAVIECLITDLNTRTNNQPLQFSESFVGHATVAGAISNPQYVRLAQAFHRTAKVTMAMKVRQGKTLAFSIEYGGPWHLPGMSLPRALRSVTLADGTEIQISSLTDPNIGRGKPNLDYLSSSGNQSILGNLKADVPPGRYVANFVLDAGEFVLPSGVQYMNDLPGQASHWPPVQAKWTEQIAVPFEVIPPDQSPVELVTDPAVDPQKNGKIVVKTLRAIHFGTGQRIVAAVSIDGTAVDCCFAVTARVAGQEHSLGSVFTARGTTTFNGGCNLTSLPADVRSVDLIFRPDPKRAESAIGMDHLWGTTIELLNQPLQRYDLEDQTPTSQSIFPEMKP